VGVLALLLWSAPLVAQQGRLAGTVVDAETGEPIEGATVRIEGTEIGTLTDPDGSFGLSGVPAGPREIVAERVGYRDASRTVRITAGELTRVEVRLSETAVELGGIRVVATRAYRAESSRVGSRTPTPLLETARSVSVVTEMTLEEQGALTKKDLYRNVAGLNEFAFNNDFTLRGFRVSGDQAVLYNGLRGNPFGSFHLDPKLTNVERVEVLKGPAGVLYGSLPPGGLMNIVTKQPREEFAHRIEARAGSFETYNLQAHSTGPLTEDGSLLYRVDLEAEDAGSFRNNQESDFVNLSGILEWRPDDRSSLRIEGGFLDENLDGRRERGVPFFQDEVFFTPIDFTSHEETDFFDNQVGYVEAHYERSFTDALSFNASGRYYDSRAQEEYHEPRGVQPDVTDVDGDGDTSELIMVRNFRSADRFRDGISVNSNVIWEVETGPVRHRWLVGGDVLVEESSVPRFQRALTELLGGPVPVIEVFSPDYNPGLSDTYRLGAFLPQGFTPDTIRQFGTESTRLGGYVQNEMQIGGLHLSGAVRFDSFDDEDLFGEDDFSDEVFTFRAGGLYEVTDDWSVYASFNEGYEPQSAANQGLALGGPFDPQESWQVEAGTKREWLDGRLTTNVAAYRITRTNELVPDPDDPGRLISLGETESEGIEVEVAGRPLPFWEITANYAFNEIEVTEDTDPDRVGETLPNAPEQTAALWSTFTVFRDRLTFGGGPQYVDVRETFDDATPNLPSYVTWEAMASYRWQEDLTLRLNVENVSDERFFTGGFGGRNGGMPGAPRNVTVAAIWTF
jgi:iron complex outermembrane receptor protein